MKYYWHSLKPRAKGPNKVLIRSNAKLCAKAVRTQQLPTILGVMLLPFAHSFMCRHSRKYPWATELSWTSEKVVSGRNVLNGNFCSMDLIIGRVRLGNPDLDFQNLNLDFPKSTLRTNFSKVKSFFGFRVRLGNPDLDFQNLNPDFPIEREIRKRISPPRNPSSGWISIKKSKSGFFRFPFLSFDWEIRKRIWNWLSLRTAVLHVHA